MKVGYLLYEKADTVGSCRFCSKNTKGIIRPPGVVGKIKSPVFICPRCKDVKWKMEELGKLFNRPYIQRIVSSDLFPVIPIDQQIRPQEGMSFKNMRETSYIFNNIGDWYAEPMIDGSRIMAYIRRDEIRFLTSQLSKKTGVYQDITDKIPHLQLAIPELEGTVLDGKLVGDDKPKLVVFDCLKFRGMDIRSLELKARQVTLSTVFNQIGKRDCWEQIDVWKFSSTEELKTLFDDVVAKGLKGLMLKNLRSPYHAKGWIKWEKEAEEISEEEARILNWQDEEQLREIKMKEEMEK